MNRKNLMLLCYIRRALVGMVLLLAHQELSSVVLDNYDQLKMMTEMPEISTAAFRQGATISPAILNTHQGRQLLHQAVKHGNESFVKIALKSDVDVNALDDNQCSALFYAVDNGNSNLIRLLMKSGAKNFECTYMHYKAITPKQLAATKDDRRALLAALNQEEYTPIARPIKLPEKTPLKFPLKKPERIAEQAPELFSAKKIFVAFLAGCVGYLLYNLHQKYSSKKTDPVSK